MDFWGMSMTTKNYAGQAKTPETSEALPLLQIP
jgi:hypothetical protein